MKNGSCGGERRYVQRARQMPQRDARLLVRLEDCYRAELTSVAAFTYRSLVTESLSGSLAALLDRIAVDENEHFRLVGSIIHSMGGDPQVRMRVQTEPYCFANLTEGQSAATLSRMLGQAVREKREAIGRYQTLLGCTDDRILRSFLSQIISDEERHTAALSDAISG